MAKDKKSFVLYCDLLPTVEKLTDEEAGKLFKHVLRYVNDLDPEADRLTELMFEPIKQALKRDLQKYENICKRNAENGKKGGRPKKPKKTKKTQSVISKPKKADNDNDSDIDSVNDINKRGVLLSWIEYRKQLKKPLTPHGIKTLVNKLNAKPLREVKWVIEHSMENGWQGLFWDKYKPEDVRTIPKDVARTCLKVPAMMEKKLSEGFTREEIENFAL